MSASHPRRGSARTVRLLRAFTVIGALTVCAWLSLNLYQAMTLENARERIFSRDALTPSEVAQIEIQLDRASFLNPDQTVEILRAGVALRRGRPEQARDSMLKVVQSEPENMEAWAAIAIGLAQTDPSLANRAREAIRRLSPLARE